MGQSTQKIPKLRFKGFLDDWKGSTIDEIIQLRSESGDQSLFSVDIELENLVSDQGIVIGDIAIRTQTNSIFRKGDILFGRLRPYLNKWWLADKEGIKSGEIWALFPRKNNVNTFIYGLIRTPKFLGYVNLTSGTKMPRADWSIIKEQPIYITSNPQEQTQIGTFFQKIDQLIKLQQEALDSAQAYKKAMLQKMFPEQGEKAPKIRFAGFSGDWERNKLEASIHFSKGKGYSKSDLAAQGVPIILYGRLYTNFQIDISKVETFVIDNNNSIYSEGGEVVIPSSGETAVDIARASVITKKGIIIGGDLNILKPNNKIDSVFLALSLTYGYVNKDLVQRAQGNTVVHLYNSDIKSLSILLPKNEEQQKIGAFFQKLDQQIEQQSEKLKHYQNLKKAMLQRLFV